MYILYRMSCIEKTTKKYTARKSPPYPANECKGKEKKGNNGKMYVSTADKNGRYRWKIKKPKKKTSAKKTKKKTTAKKPKKTAEKKAGKNFDELEIKIRELSDYAKGNGFKPSEVQLYLELYGFI